jgi:hypothetical protein
MAVLAVVFCGCACAGALYAHTLGASAGTEISNGLEEYLRRFSGPLIDRLDIFRGSLIKYMKTVLALWFMAFVPYGGFFVFLIIAARGVAYGFTTALIVELYGPPGIVCAALLYAPQCVLLPALLLLARWSVTYCRGRNFRGTDGTGVSVPDTGAVAALALSCAAAVIAGLADSFAVPVFIRGLLN